MIEGTLGRGGMGHVLLARDTVLERHVALKVISPDRTRRDDTATRFMREARLAAKMTHPNAVHVYDTGDVGGVLFIAMEYVRGKTLTRFIGESASTVEQKLLWCFDVARALAAAHDLGLLHRDVKPDNVLVSVDDVAKLTDFGLATRRLVSPAMRESIHTEAGFIVGTPAFMAPEQLRGEDIDPRADQFAWALMTYVVITGVQPRIIGKGRREHARPLYDAHASVPRRAADAVARAMAPERADRFRDMHVLVAELSAALSLRSSFAPPRVDTRRSERPPREVRSSAPPTKLSAEEALDKATRLRTIARGQKDLSRLMATPPAPALGAEAPADHELLAESWWFSTIVSSCPVAPLRAASFWPDATGFIAIGRGGIASFNEGRWTILDAGVPIDEISCVTALRDGGAAIGGHRGLALRISRDGELSEWELRMPDPSAVTFRSVDALCGEATELVFAGDACGRAAAGFARDAELEVSLGDTGPLGHACCGLVTIGCGEEGISLLTPSSIALAVDLPFVVLSATALDLETFAIGGVDGAIDVLAPLSCRFISEQAETTAAIVAIAAADPQEAWAMDVNASLYRRARGARWLAWPRAPILRDAPIALSASNGRLLAVDANGVMLEGRRYSP